MPRLPLPLVKICDFGYSKAENKSAAKSKVRAIEQQLACCSLRAACVRGAHTAAAARTPSSCITLLRRPCCISATQLQRARAAPARMTPAVRAQRPRSRITPAVLRTPRTMQVGTLTYMAPEVLINITRDGKYDGKVRRRMTAAAQDDNGAASMLRRSTGADIQLCCSALLVRCRAAARRAFKAHAARSGRAAHTLVLLLRCRRCPGVRPPLFTRWLTSGRAASFCM